MTAIEWTHRPGTKGESWNPIRARNRETGKVGHWCVRVNDACRNCYAATMNGWRGAGIDYAAQNRNKVELFVDDAALLAPLRWRAPRTVFVCSMTDLFGEFHVDAWIDRLFAVMALCPRHTFLVLTKRPARLREYFAREFLAEAWWEAGDRMACDLNLSEFHPGDVYLNAGKGKTPIPLPNVWLGVTVHDQPSAEAFVPELLFTPAAKRFISYEPALGPIDLHRIMLAAGHDRIDALNGFIENHPRGTLDHPKLDWVIVGGESGPGARPMHPDWARSVRDQCAAAGVPFFFKQWGNYVPWRPRMDGSCFLDGPTLVAAHCPKRRPSIQPGYAVKASPEFPKWMFVMRLNKKAAGAMLDGREWREFPSTELRRRGLGEKGTAAGADAAVPGRGARR